MSNILITGNGFDLYHKRPTRYTDFLVFVEHWESFYAKLLSNTNKANNFDKDVQYNVRLSEKGRLIEESIEDFYKIAECIDDELLADFDNIVSNNVWIKYFFENKYSKDSWIDFEAEIENVLVNIERFFTKELPSVEGKILQRAINPRCLDVIYFLMNNTEALPLNIGVYSKETIEFLIYSSTKKQLLEELRKELDQLIKALHIYLFEFVSRMKVTCYSEQVKDMGMINVLNFNYTYTYVNVYGGRNLKEHHQIHGSLQEDNMVLGISDENFDELDYVYFQKYFQRIQKRTGAFYREWLLRQYKTHEDEPVDVYIFGHSLGMTDKGVLDEFFLNRERINHIYIYYHNQQAYEDLVIALIKLYTKNFVIEQTGNGRIEFIKLAEPIEGDAKINEAHF